MFTVMFTVMVGESSNTIKIINSDGIFFIKFAAESVIVVQIIKNTHTHTHTNTHCSARKPTDKTANPGPYSFLYRWLVGRYVITEPICA